MVKQAGKRFLVIAPFLLGSLIVVEIFLELFNVTPVLLDDSFRNINYVPFYIPDPIRIYRVNRSTEIPGLLDHKTDERGFRYNPSHEKSTVGVRGVLFGDSFVFGHGVNHRETIAYYLEEVLLSMGIDVSIDNAGIPGYSPDQEYLYIKELLYSNPKPAFIIWAFNVNDVSDSNRKCLFRLNGSSYQQASAQQSTFYIRHVYLYPALRTLPRFIRDLRLLSVLLYPLQQSYTLGCTKTKGLTQEEFTQKLTFFLSDIRKLTGQEGIRLLPIIVLDESTLLRNLPSALEAFQTRQSITRAAKRADVALVDMNDRYEQQVNSQGKVLDASTLERDNLFLNENKSTVGNRHPSAHGNLYSAAAILPEIVLLLRSD